MKPFSLFVEEEKAKTEKHTVLAFGRFQPPHVGHEKLVNKVHEVAKEHGANHHIVLSKTHDNKTNPLEPHDKHKIAKEYFPGANIELADEEHPTILHHAKKLNSDHTHLHVVAGEDRVTEYQQLLDKYNHRDYDYKSIHVHSSGKRTPDGQGVEGVSSSKLRDYAKIGNFKDFARSIPRHISDKAKKEVFNKVRKGMNLKENKALFVVGPQGSGKDIVISEVKKHFNIVETSLEQLQSRKQLHLENYDNILISALANDAEVLQILESYLTDNGYDTHMIYAWLSNEESQKRNESRNAKTSRVINEEDRHRKWVSCDENYWVLERIFEGKFYGFDNGPSIDENLDVLVEVFQEINSFLNKKDSINIEFDTFFESVKDLPAILEEQKTPKTSFAKFVKQGPTINTNYNQRSQGGSFPYSMQVASESIGDYGEMSTVTSAGKENMETIHDQEIRNMKPEPAQKKSFSKVRKSLDGKKLG